MIDKAALTDIILNKEGYVIIDDVLDSKFISRARKELELAISKEAEYHGGDDYSDYGMVLLCALYGGAFIELFDIEGVTTPINNILGDGSIVYAYTSSSMLPNGKNYSNRIHVDCPRLIPGYSTNLGVIIPLDDFTEKNGATFILPGSQNMLESPDEDYFYKNAKMIIAKAGSVIFLNSRLWHSGGNNETNDWRHSLTLNICRPYMKQRIDIPRAMNGMDTSGFSQIALQKLGFYAQIPVSYDEYYIEPKQRKFKQKYE